MLKFLPHSILLLIILSIAGMVRAEIVLEDIYQGAMHFLQKTLMQLQHIYRELLKMT